MIERMIRSLFIVLILSTLSGFRTAEETINWVTLAEAQAMAGKDSKAIFIDFTADWCGWCKVMDQKTFSDSTVASYMAENFYTVRLDYDSTEKLDFFGEKLTARELGTRYKVPGLPTILLLSADSKKSKKLVGFKKPEPFLKALRSAKL